RDPRPLPKPARPLQGAPRHTLRAGAAAYRIGQDCQARIVARLSPLPVHRRRGRRHMNPTGVNDFCPWRKGGPSGMKSPRRTAGLQMRHFSFRKPCRPLPALAAVTLLSLSCPTLAADDDAPRGPAVTVLKAAKSCFANIVEVSGIVLPREETAVRPERLGLKVADVLADAGDNGNAGP